MNPWNPTFVPRAEVLAWAPERDRNGRFKGLYVAGSLAGLGRKTVAVIGSRRPSEGGKERARALGAALARAGLCVISGLAKGIDGAAHRGALDARGLTIGILGGGHEDFYPKQNLALARSMVAAGGAVVSPFAPMRPSHPWQFLQRNAIVAELSEAVVVVEAADRSGALNTANWAADNNIPVFAFPGDVDRPMSAGCNALIRDGAILVRHANDVLESLKLNSAQTPELPFDDGPSADPGRAVVRVLYERGPLHLEELAVAMDLAPGTLMGLLVRLEMEGSIRRREDATYARAQA